MKLNFTITELVQSETAKKYGIDNMPYNTQIVDNLLLLILNVLQPLRDYIKKPIIVNSGFRSVALNAKVGGVANSQHIEGKAADIVIKGMSIPQIMNAVKLSGITFDQCINEKTWVHISYNKNKNRRQFL